MKRNEATVGMKVTILAVAKRLCSKAHCEWNDRMDKTIGETGVVTDIRRNGNSIRVKLETGARKGETFFYTPGSIGKVETTRVAKVGDRVRVKASLQRNHRMKYAGWVDTLNGTIGKEGRILETDSKRSRVDMGRAHLGAWYYDNDCLEFLDGTPVHQVSEKVEVAPAKPRVAPKPVVPEVTYKVGNIFKDKDNGLVYQIIATGRNEVVLAGIKTGNRWDRTFVVRDTQSITRREFLEFGSECMEFIHAKFDDYVASLVAAAKPKARKVEFTEKKVSYQSYTSAEEFERVNPGKTFVRFID